MDKLLLTPIEAAAALGIGRSKLYELMRTGIVTSVRIGNCRRVPATSLSELVARLQGDSNGQEVGSVPVHRTARYPQQSDAPRHRLSPTDRSWG